MTFQPQAPGACLADELRTGLEIAGRLPVLWDDETVTPDSQVLSGPATCDAALSTDLSQLVELGHQVDLRWHIGGFHARLEVLAHGRCHVHDADSLEDVFSTTEDAAEFARAAGAADLQRCLRALQDTQARLQIKISNPADSNMTWLPSIGLLERELTSERWLPFAKRLTKGITPESTSRRAIAISGLTIPPLTTEALLICAAESPTADIATLAAASFHSSKVSPTRDLPPPTLSAPAAVQGTHPFAPLMRGLVHALTWMHIAAEYSASEPPTVRFQGVRDLRLPLTVASSEVEIAPALELYEWATSTSDPAARDALQQATTFAVTVSSDLADAASPVLRTARSLFELARRGAVTEALATRRAAREAAQASAREASRSARDAAAKSVERGVVLGFGAAGAVLAKTQELVTTAQTLFTVLVLALLLALSLFVALRSEIAVGRDAIDSFRIDADAYREALSRDDVEDIKNAAALTKAEGALSTASAVAIGTHGALAVGLLLVALFLPEWKKPAAESPAPSASASPSVSAVATSTPSPAPSTRASSATPGASTRPSVSAAPASATPTP